MSAAKANQKSVSMERTSPAAESSTTGKRGRGRPSASSRAKTDSDDEVVAVIDKADSDEEEEEVKKKRKTGRGSTGGKASAGMENGSGKGAGGKGASKRRSMVALAKEDEGDGDVMMGDVSADPEDQGKFSTMKNSPYMVQKNWEDLVRTITTVERVGDLLMVYFELCVRLIFFRCLADLLVFSFLFRTDGQLIRESSKLCAQRFPLKVRSIFFSQFALPDYRS